MVNIPLFTGFHTSQVVQDFSHQQYLHVFSSPPDLSDTLIMPQVEVQSEGDLCQTCVPATTDLENAKAASFSLSLLLESLSLLL